MKPGVLTLLVSSHFQGSVFRPAYYMGMRLAITPSPLDELSRLPLVERPRFDFEFPPAFSNWFKRARAERMWKDMGFSSHPYWDFVHYLTIPIGTSGHDLFNVQSGPFGTIVEEDFISGPVFRFAETGDTKHLSLFSEYVRPDFRRKVRCI